MKLISSLLDLKTFKSLDSESFEIYSAIARQWDVPFDGVTKELLQMLKNPRTELDGILLICKWQSSEMRQYIEPAKNIGKKAEVLWMLQILPWIYYNLSLPATNPDGQLSKKDYTRGYETAILGLKALLKVFEEKSKSNFNDKISNLMKKLISYEEHQSFPVQEKSNLRLSFIQETCKLIHHTIGPEHMIDCIKQLAQLFHIYSQKFYSSLSTISKVLLSQQTSSTLPEEAAKGLTEMIIAASLDVSAIPQIEFVNQFIRSPHLKIHGEETKPTKNQNQLVELVFRLGTLKQVAVGARGSMLDSVTDSPQKPPQQTSHPESDETPSKRPIFNIGRGSVKRGGSKSGLTKKTSSEETLLASPKPRTKKKSVEKPLEPSRRKMRERTKSRSRKSNDINQQQSRSPKVCSSLENISSLKAMLNDFETDDPPLRETRKTKRDSQPSPVSVDLCALVNELENLSDTSGEYVDHSDDSYEVEDGGVEYSVIEKQLKLLAGEFFDNEDLQNLGGTQKVKDTRTSGHFDLDWNAPPENEETQFVMDESIADALNGLRGFGDSSDYSSSDYSSGDYSDSGSG